MQGWGARLDGHDQGMTQDWEGVNATYLISEDPTDRSRESLRRLVKEEFPDAMTADLVMLVPLRFASKYLLRKQAFSPESD